MAVETIRLPGGEWEFDDAIPLGEAGGFGEVFRGRGKDGDVAVKRLKISAIQAAHRELDIGQELMQRELSHVVPILDAGQDANSDRYFLVMPICDCSLQDTIDKTGDGVDISIVKDVIGAIIAGLKEVGDITHRDLKPANILLHEGNWKIADFGIAKFVEDSTSLETLRDSLTPDYAAPEQWRGERPTSATDVYALGCITHTLMSGHPPFSGSIDDIREQHFHAAPAQISALPPRFAAFVSHMLRKPPMARPSLDRCSQVFSDLQLEEQAEPAERAVLANAARQVAEREVRIEAEQHAAETRRRERDTLFEDAKRELFSIMERLFGSIQSHSESAKVDHHDNLIFGHAKMGWIRKPDRLETFVLARHNDGREPYAHSGWDVLGYAIIGVTCEIASESRPYTWSATLLFADRKDGNQCRWYEVAFFSLAPARKDAPFGLDGYEADIDLALGNVMHTVNVAYGPCPIDGEDEESFMNRWIELVAKAATGELSTPSYMPIRDFG